jgi:hypothetical protein
MTNAILTGFPFLIVCESTLDALAATEQTLAQIECQLFGLWRQRAALRLVLQSIDGRDELRIPSPCSRNGPLLA